MHVSHCCSFLLFDKSHQKQETVSTAGILHELHWLSHECIKQSGSLHLSASVCLVYQLPKTFCLVGCGIFAVQVKDLSELWKSESHLYSCLFVCFVFFSTCHLITKDGGDYTAVKQKLRNNLVLSPCPSCPPATGHSSASPWRICIVDRVGTTCRYTCSLNRCADFVQIQLAGRNRDGLQ